MKESNRVCVIVVLYYPNTNDINLILNVFKDNKTNLIFIDNTPNIINGVLDDLAKENANKIYYEPQQSNIGIAEAQNIGILKAKDIDDVDFLLFLDQDSTVEKRFVQKMIKEYQLITNSGISIAALGPTIIHKVNGKKYKQEASSIKNLQSFYTPSAIISSGMFVSLKTMIDVGFMESKLFIDAVDFEWCWRAKSKGYLCCITKNVIMKHKVGIKDKTFLGYDIVVSSPIRNYYQYRNFILLCMRSYVPMDWKIKNFLKKIFFLFYIPLFTANGMQSLSYIFKGIYAGFSEFGIGVNKDLK